MDEEDSLLNKRGDAYCACRYLECGRKFKSLKALEQHLLLYHNISWDAYTRYSPSHHCESQENALDDPLGKRKDAYCMCTYMECGRKFKMLKNLEEHVTLYHNISWQVYTQYYHRWVWKTKDDRPSKAPKIDKREPSHTVVKAAEIPHLPTARVSDQDNVAMPTVSPSMPVSPGSAANQMVSYMAPAAVAGAYVSSPYPYMGTSVPLVPTVIQYQPVASPMLVPSSVPFTTPQMMPVTISPTYLNALNTFPESSPWSVGQSDAAPVNASDDGALNLSFPKPEKLHTTKLQKSAASFQEHSISPGSRLYQMKSTQTLPGKSPQHVARKESYDKESPHLQGDSFLGTVRWSRAASPRMSLPDIRNGVIVIQPDDTSESGVESKPPVQASPSLSVISPSVSRLYKPKIALCEDVDCDSIKSTSDTKDGTGIVCFSRSVTSKMQREELDHLKASLYTSNPCNTVLKTEENTPKSNVLLDCGDWNKKESTILNSDMILATGNYLGQRSLSQRGRSASEPDLQSLVKVDQTLSFSAEKVKIDKRSKDFKYMQKTLRNDNIQRKEHQRKLKRLQCRTIETRDLETRKTAKSLQEGGRPSQWKHIYSSRVKYWCELRYKQYLTQHIKWQYSYNLSKLRHSRALCKNKSKANLWPPKKNKLHIVFTNHPRHQLFSLRKYPGYLGSRVKQISKDTQMNLDKSKGKIDTGSLPAKMKTMKKDLMSEMESYDCPLRVLSPEEQLQAVKSSSYTESLDPERAIRKVRKSQDNTCRTMPKISRATLPTLDLCSDDVTVKQGEEPKQTPCAIPMLKCLAYDTITKMAPTKYCQKAWDMHIKTLVPSSGRVRHTLPCSHLEVSKSKTSIKVEVKFEHKSHIPSVTDAKVAITTLTPLMKNADHGGLVCTECHLSFSCNRDYIRHRFQHHRMMQCRICEDAERGSSHLYRYQATVARHLMVNHRIMAALDLSTVTCGDCYAGKFGFDLVKLQ